MPLATGHFHGIGAGGLARDHNAEGGSLAA